MYDPLDYFSQLTRNPLAGIVPAPKREPMFQPLEPAEEASFLGKISDKFLGGVSLVGQWLDKLTGGRAARGLLSGNPREGLSILPGSDWAGLTEEADVVSGKQLLEKAGWLDQDSEGFWPTVAGIGADIALSPATYFSGPARALTETGKQLQKLQGLAKTTRGRMQGYQTAAEIPEAAREAGKVAGVFPTVQTLHTLHTDFSSVLNKPQGGWLEFQVPFMPSTRHVFGAGPSGEKFLDALNTTGRGLQQAAHYGGWLNPLGYAAWPVELAYKGYQAAKPYVTPLFNPAYMNVFGDEAAQAFAAKAYDARKALEVKANRDIADLFYDLRRSHLMSDSPQPVTWTAGRRTYTATLPPMKENAATELIADVLEHPDLYRTLVSPLEQAAQHYGGRIVALTDPFRQRAIQQGFDAPPLRELNWATGDPIGYLMRHSREVPPRTMLEAWQDLGSGSGPVHQLHPSVLSGREKWTRGLDRQMYNELIQHPQLASPLQQPLTSAPGVSPALNKAERLNILRDKLPYASDKDLAEVMEALATKDPSRPAFFDRFIVDDLRDTLLGFIRRDTGAEAVHGILGKGLKELGHVGTERYLPLSQDLFKDAGFSADNWANAADRVFQKAGVTAPPSLADYARYGVDPGDLANATRVLRGFAAPSVLRPILGVADWLTNLTKSALTNPWSGFHVRNLGGGQLADAQAGMASARGLAGAKALMAGQASDDILQHPWLAGQNLTPEQAVEELQKLVYAHGVRHHGVQDAVAALDPGGEFSKRFIGAEPFAGFLPEGGRQITGLWRDPGGWNPTNVRGVLGNEASAFAPIKHGENIGQGVEDLNRVAPFLEAGWQGYSPGAAAQLVGNLQGDLSRLSDFERHVMRRLVPFYSWPRLVGTDVVRTMLHQPGGLYGQTAMAANEVRQNQKQFIPEYLGGGLAIPVGEEQEGTQRFLTKLDINPAEGVFDVVRPTVRGTGLSLLGQLNPLLKVPLELFTGTQFHSGRNLEELRGLTGNVVADQLIGGGPLSKLASIYTTLTDPRKYERPLALPVNLLTGVRLSDVDMEKQREYAARDWITEQLRGQPGVRVMQRPFVPRADLDKLSPQDVLLMRLNANLEKRAAERRKQEAAGQAPR